MGKAYYLLRFDDICPTMNWRIWSEIESLLIQSGIRPILAVVPDNRDPKLMIDPGDANFWGRVRSWQSKGWAIALHGYQHYYTNRNPGILRLTPQSEFAGLARVEQEAKLESGLAIFHREGVRTDCWVAPSHSFDWTTVELLAELGVKVISDGLWPWPHTGRRGMTWVPQQLWDRLCPRLPGVWTACYHHNTWSAERLEHFRSNIKGFTSQITSLANVLDSFKGRRLTLLDRVRAEWGLTRNHRLGPLLMRLSRGHK